MSENKVNEWVSRIERAQKRAKKEWLDDGRRALRIYHNGKPSRASLNNREPFNILYSNTETLSPALFNSAPRPDVAARRAKADPVVKLGAQALHQYLDFLIDSNDARYETFTDVISQAVVSALVPGLGQIRVREPESPGAHLSVESVPFDRFLWGWARRWQDVPWIAFGHDLTFLDFKSRYPKAAKELNEDQVEAGEYGFNSAGGEGEHDDKTTRVPGVLVWEIWDKASRKIFEVCDQIPGMQLAERPWPLNFSSSFPCPRPLTFVEKVGTLAPTPLYCFYENQAEELNRVTRRLNKIIEAIKVRGVYNSMLGEISRVLEEEEDSALVPAQSAQLMAENGGIDRHIWLMPIEELMKVAKELFAARQEIKGTIYEIMGIADILRGQSVASETATAQGIKDRWGTLRLKKSQRMVQFFIRDTFRLLAEAAPQVVPVESWQAATDLSIPTEQEKAQKLAELAPMMLMGQQMPPEQGQQLEAQKQELESLPTWEQVLSFLQNDAQRTYRIDVETNSTVDIEATEDKAAIAEFMNAMGQFLAGIAPMVEQQIMPFEAAKGMLLEIMRRFRFSKQVEEYLMQMQPPQQQKGDPEAEKQRKEAETAIEKLKDFELKIKDAMRELENEGKDLEFQKKEFAMEQKHAQQMQQMTGQMQEIKLNGKVQAATSKLENTATKIAGTFQQKGMEIDQRAREVQDTEKRVKETTQGTQKSLDPLIQMLQVLQQNQVQMGEALKRVTEEVTALQSDESEREIAMMGSDGKIRTAVVRKSKRPAKAKMN